MYIRLRCVSRCPDDYNVGQVDVDVGVDEVARKVICCVAHDLCLENLHCLCSGFIPLRPHQEVLRLPIQGPGRY